MGRASDAQKAERLNRARDLLRQFEKTLLARALAHTGGRRIEAAQLLGLGRNTLTRKIQELEIEPTRKED